MGALDIERVSFDQRTRMLSFSASSRRDTTRLTIVSSIRLDHAPKSETLVRWAIMKRSAELLDGAL